MQKMELDFVVNVLQGNAINVNIDWYAVVGFLELNRISGFFYQKAIAQGVKLPPQVASCLRRTERYQRLRGHQMLEWLKSISMELERERIKYAILKGNALTYADFSAVEGMHFCSSYYDEGGRSSNDIDLLVHPRDVGKVERVLSDLGFVQGYYSEETCSVRHLSRREILERRLNRGETVPFQRMFESAELPHIEIDINFSLDYLPGGMKGILEKMMARTALYSVREGGAIRSLEEIDFLIHLILHQYKEMRVYSMVIRGKDLEMYKLLDIYLMLSRISQKRFLERVMEYHLEQQTAVVLKVVSGIFSNLELCDELEDMTRGYFWTAERVIDPTQKDKPYVWTVEPADRLMRFDHTGFLVETT